MKRKLLIAAGCLVALVLAFSAGRFAAPSKVHVAQVMTTVVVTKEVTKVVEAKAKVVTIDRVVTREGEVRERIVERVVTKRETDSEKSSTVDQSSKTDKVTTHDAPRLNVSVLVGADLSPAWQPIQGAGPLAVGLSVQYRIAGPLTVGAWGVHTGAFGVSVGATF